MLFDWRKRATIAALRQMHALYTDFVRTATMYAKLIVSERFLAPDQKTVKPAGVGGIAGGDKFVAEGSSLSLSLSFSLFLSHSPVADSVACGFTFDGTLACGIRAVDRWWR